MTRVIHTGDTHVGYRQYHSPERRQDFLDAFEQVIDDAIEQEVDAVVHAGDLFHDRRPELTDLLGTLSALRRLDAAEIPFLAIVGNHESTRGGQWLDLFESLGLATRLGAEPVVVENTAFYGLDHVPESKRDDLAYDFDPHDAAHAALVAHGLFEPFAYANWETETVIRESSVAFDALLLGDNHTPDTARVADTWVTYPGSTERASASERDARGYNLVTFDDGVDIRRRSLDTRAFVFVSVELADGEGIERVRDRIREQDVTDAVVIVEVTGEGEPVTPADVESFTTEQGALIARVTDRREIETTEAVSVDFADPDRAVDERLTEAEFSAVAHEIDGLVRDTTNVADSNLRDRVKRRVTERIEAGTLREELDDEATDPSEADDPSGVDDSASDDATGDDGVGDGETDADEDATGASPADATTADGEVTDDATADSEVADDATADGEVADDATADGEVAGDATTVDGAGGETTTDGETDETSGGESEGDEQITLGDW